MFFYEENVDLADEDSWEISTYKLLIKLKFKDEVTLSKPKRYRNLKMTFVGSLLKCFETE